MNFTKIFYIIGWFVVGLGSIMLLIAVGGIFIFHAHDQFFFIASLVNFFLGFSLILLNRSSLHSEFEIRDAFLLVTLGWSILSICASLPFLFAGLTFADSLFESTSALTTTGASILDHLDRQPRVFLLWRAILQWIGGIGIIAMAMIVFPNLRIGGMQLFRRESSDQSEKIFPHLRQVLYSLLLIYSILNIGCGLSFILCGMPVFDALCYAPSIISTCGLGVNDASFGAYNNPIFDLIACVFMLIGGFSLSVLIEMFFYGKYKFWQNAQIRFYLLLILFIAAINGVWLYSHQHYSLFDSFRYSIFQSISLVSTTGLVNTDFNLWSGLPLFLLFIGATIGGCSGSTSGGIKIFRLQIFLQMILMQIKKLRYPNRVFFLTYMGKQVSEQYFNSIVSFIGVYIGSVLFICLSLLCCNLDLATAISGSIAVISNAGPGVGSIIGPYGSYSALSDTAKYFLSLGMLLGRLEFFTVIILLSKSFWRS